MTQEALTLCSTFGLEQGAGALAAGEIKKSEFASMRDRILVFQNKPQRYGTLIVPRPGSPPRLAEIEDVEHLDQRRQLMELPSMDEQLRNYERDLGIVIDHAGLRQSSAASN